MWMVSMQPKWSLCGISLIRWYLPARPTHGHWPTELLNACGLSDSRIIGGICGLMDMANRWIVISFPSKSIFKQYASCYLLHTIYGSLHFAGKQTDSFSLLWTGVWKVLTRKNCNYTFQIAPSCIVARSTIDCRWVTLKFQQTAVSELFQFTVIHQTDLVYVGLSQLFIIISMLTIAAKAILCEAYIDFKTL